jgi:hypothetical protein
MAEPAIDTRTEAPPYEPSWIDRLTDWVETLPIRGWVFYVELALILILVQMLLLWLDGAQQAAEILPVIIYNGVATPYVLALIHLLDHQAVVALKAMGPALELTDSEIDRYQYELSTMPPRPTVIAGLVTAALVILAEQLWMVPIRYGVLDQLPVFNVGFQIVDKLSAILFGSLLYHSVRQLRLVNAINSTGVRINLFHLRPLQAFSRLTSSTAVGLVAFFYIWMLINPELLSDPGMIGLTLALTVLAVVVFVWPLFGIHQRMDMEKQRMLQALDLGFEDAFSRFNSGLRDDDHAELDRLNGVIASLEIQHSRVQDIPTWPWRPRTIGPLLAAIVLPLALELFLFFVEQALG